VRDWLSYHTARFRAELSAGGRSARDAIRPGRGPGGSRRMRVRHWRHTRPFWGSLLLLMAGIELILIPLSGILVRGAVKLVIYIGIGGVFGILIGILLITCGLLLCLTPGHRTFYAVAGVVLGLLSFITSNLGGFFLGMLLAITGGSLAYAWTPGQVGDEDAEAAPSAADLGEHDGDTAILPGLDPAYDNGADENGAGDAGAGDAGRPWGGKLLAGAALPVLLAGSLLGAHGQAQHPATPSPGADASPAAGASPAQRDMIAQPEPGLEAPTAASVITAGSATLNGLAYQGTAKVPEADGGEQTMMKFTLTSITLSGDVTATVTGGGETTVTQSSSLAFSGGVTLYATELSGSLLGVPVTLTPDSVVSVLLQVLNTLTPLVSLTLTNVTTDQPIVMAGALQATALSITVQ
jgi:hypothetical protein